MRKPSRLFDVANFIHDPNYSLVQGRIGRGGSLVLPCYVYGLVVAIPFLP